MFSSLSGARIILHCFLEHDILFGGTRPTCDVIKMFSVTVIPSLHHYGININDCLSLALHENCMR